MSRPDETSLLAEELRHAERMRAKADGRVAIEMVTTCVVSVAIATGAITLAWTLLHQWRPDLVPERLNVGSIAILVCCAFAILASWRYLVTLSQRFDRIRDRVEAQRQAEWKSHAFLRGRSAGG